MFKPSLFLCGFVAVIGVSNAVYYQTNYDANNGNGYDSSYTTVNNVVTTYDSNGVPVPAGGVQVYQEPQYLPAQGQDGYEQTQITQNYYTIQPQPQAAAAPASSGGLFGIFDKVVGTAGRIAGGAVGTVMGSAGGLVGAAMGGPKASIDMAKTGAGLGMAMGNNIG